MSRHRPRSRASRPSPEVLESRQLLSATVSGTDIDGDKWVLQLIGPGTLRVTNQPDSTGTPVPLSQPGSIDTITIGGADPTSTRLVGYVTKSATGDGKVFFNTLTELGGRSESTAASNGIGSIDMPGFWLGNTSTSAPTTTTEPSINIPDGVVTLRFGGADTTYTPPGGTPLNTNGTANTFRINLGLPRTLGTSIIVNKVVTDAQAPATSTGTATQNSVVFSVAGRINTFQANEIDGNTTYPATGLVGGGGTVVQSQQITTSNIAGNIGFVRVGGNATDFGVQTSGQVSNFYIGGETNYVTLVGASGTRNIQFGKGMDNTTILSHFIETLQANRDAIGSQVTVDRNIGRMTVGGDVKNTQVLSGYAVNFSSIINSQTLPTTPPPAQDGGAINNVLIAGNVSESIFAASVDPYVDPTTKTSLFDVPQALLFPHGHIGAKVEGTITNTTVSPDHPNQAFYAKAIKGYRGPVLPPSVPEAPFPYPTAAPHGPRIVSGLQPPGGRSIPKRLSGTTTAGTSTGTSSGVTTAANRHASLVAARKAALAARSSSHGTSKSGG